MTDSMEMSDPMEKVTEGQDLLGKIQNFVSGFLGYYDRERRRDADKILRDGLAQRYEQQWQRISDLQKQLIANKQLELVDDLEAAAVKIRGFIDRVKNAPRGYAGFFDAVRINQDELEKLYQYDLMLLQKADQLGSAIDGVESAFGKQELPAVIATLVRVAADVSATYELRDETVMSH